MPQLAKLKEVADALIERGFKEAIPRLDHVTITGLEGLYRLRDARFTFHPSVLLYQPDHFSLNSPITIPAQSIWKTSDKLREYIKVQKIIDQKDYHTGSLEESLGYFNDTADLIRTIPDMEAFVESLNWERPPEVLPGTIRQVRNILAVYGGDAHG